MRKHLLGLILFAGLILAAIPAPAAPREEPREVLVLYKGSSLAENSVSLFREGFHMPANYLGLLPRYTDIETSPLPAPTALNRVRAVITSFETETMDDPNRYLHWLNAVMDQGIYVIILGHLGCLESTGNTPPSASLLERTLTRIGLTRTDMPSINGTLIQYGTKTDRIVEFERKLPAIPLRYDGFKAASESEVLLSVRRRDRPEADSPAIAITRTGGFALYGFIYWQDPISFKKQWYLDPFTFLERALRLQGVPAPTPTTLNGSRVAYSHIDADGFSGVSRIDPGRTCGEVMNDEVLTQTDFPVTVSLIQGEVDPRYAKTDRHEALARKIFRIPWIEPGSHAFSHPYFWNSEDEKTAARYREELGYSQFGVDIPGYTTFDRVREITGSARYVSTLAPEDKPCRVFQWSGACDPTAKDLAEADRAGLLNINGGDTVLDQEHNSLFTVAPICIEKGGHFQYFTGQANENILTNLWTGPFFGYRNIIETMKRTESPRRLAPLNVYFHFYSAEYPSSLKAVQDVFAWVLDQDVAPVHTSHYLMMARGFTTAKIHRLGKNTFRISDYGRCTTLRLPHGGAFWPDLQASSGVIGYRETRQGLFIHLNPDKHEARLVLTDSPSSSPFLEQATGTLENIQISSQQITFRYTGHTPGRVVIAGIPSGTDYELFSGTDRAALTPGTSSLTITVSAPGETGVRKR